MVRRDKHSLGSDPNRCVMARRRGALGPGGRSGLVITVLAAMLYGSLGCSEQFSGAEDALGDTAARIEQSVLPPIVEETEVMLRTFVNFLPLLPEVCATPVGELGDFVSQLPELQRAQQQVGDTFSLDDRNGFWQAAWRDVVFGDPDGRHAATAGTPSVDIRLTARFRNAGLASVRAVPFALPSSELVQTSREPGDLLTCTESTPEGFYLFQDQMTGVWTLAWCTQATNKVFQGELSASAFSRVSRKISPTTTEEVSSLTVNTSSTNLRFEESASPMVAEGIRFFVRPGELITFELRSGPAVGDTSSITREELRIGVFNENEVHFLPSDLDPADFQLATAVPMVPTGQPDFTVRNDFATFVWQDDTQGPCTEMGETLWHLRFHTATPVLFSGFLTIPDDDLPNSRLRVLRVGRCQEGLFQFEDNNKRLSYECVVDEVAENGYDVCVSGALRLQFSPEVNEVRDPSRVWIGGENRRPPAQDPFTMLFELEMEERRAPARNLVLDNSRIILLGTTEETNEVRLRDDQVSLEALCQPIDGTPVHVRLIGNGEYATERFEGGRYEFEDLEFTNALQTYDVSAQRLPNRGELELRTRDENDTAEIIVPASKFADTDGRVTSTIDITLTLDTLQLDFLDRTVNLSLE
jgi:hypothetical protein